MTEDSIHLAVIIGSTREGRFGPTVARWFVTQVQQRPDIVLDVIDLADLHLPAVYPARRGPAVEEYAERVGAADAFVVVTPEYNHGYPASIKQAVDLLKLEWQAKPVGFVSYGGIAGGLRAVEQLRQVFAELHAVGLRDTVSFHNYGELFDGTGHLVDPTGPNLAAKVLLDRLAWWASALRSARAAKPFAA